MAGSPLPYTYYLISMDGVGTYRTQAEAERCNGRLIDPGPTELQRPWMLTMARRDLGQVIPVDWPTRRKGHTQG